MILVPIFLITLLCVLFVGILLSLPPSPEPSSEGIITDKWMDKPGQYRFEIDDCIVVEVSEYDYHNHDIHDIYTYKYSKVVSNDCK